MLLVGRKRCEHADAIDSLAHDARPLVTERLAEYPGVGLQWPPQRPSIFQAHVLHLCHRMQQLAWIYHHRNQTMLTDACHDLNM